MSVSSFRELARSLEGEVGGATVAKRKFVVILDDNASVVPTANLEVAKAVGGGTWGVAHPEFDFLKLRKVTMSEIFGENPYHVEVNLEYGVLASKLQLAPLARPSEWVFESVAGDQIPALFFYDDSSTKRPLTNSAYDFFEGLTVPESLTRATITKNYGSRPDGILGSFGYLNDASFSGAGKHCCKHEGSKVEQVEELWGNVRYNYWRAESQILFRPSGWNLQLPDVGFNFISGGQKRRAMVFDFQNSEWIPSAGPLGLDGSGGLTGGYPTILNRRVLPETSFSALFGSPPA
jgi:hypothetical protein